MESKKIETMQAIAFFSIISVNSIILSSSQIIVTSCSSSSLINIVFITFLLLIFFLIVSLLYKFSNQNLIEISNFVGGKFFKIFIGLLYICYFLFTTSIFLNKISGYLQIIYFPMTNTIFIISLFCITAGIVSYLDNNFIFKTVYLILPLLFIIVFLVFIGNIKNFDYTNIFPILGNRNKFYILQWS